jgi:hypothetical protein
MLVLLCACDSVYVIHMVSMGAAWEYYGSTELGGPE